MIVVGEAADGATAVDLTRKTHPDVVLMDIRMPGVDGLHAAREIAADPDLVGVHVLILTTFDHDEYVIEEARSAASPVAPYVDGKWLLIMMNSTG